MSSNSEAGEQKIFPHYTCHGNRREASVVYKHDAQILEESKRNPDKNKTFLKKKDGQDRPRSWDEVKNFATDSLCCFGQWKKMDRLVLTGFIIFFFRHANNDLFSLKIVTSELTESLATKTCPPLYPGTGTNTFIGMLKSYKNIC